MWNACIDALLRHRLKSTAVQRAESAELRLNVIFHIRNEQTAKAIFALARRKELGGINGTLWKILSPGYRPTLLKKNEPGDYILWALNHPAEFESTYNGMLQKMVRGRS